MGFYSSWGPQANFKAQRCERPDVSVSATRLGTFVARCTTCSWRSAGYHSEIEAAARGRQHAPRRTSDRSEQGRLRQALTARGVRRRIRQDFGPFNRKDHPWVGALERSSELADVVLHDYGELVAAAVRGESVPDIRVVPDDSGGISLGDLRAGWATDAPLNDLHAARQWGQRQYRGQLLPLKGSYCPSLFVFLEGRTDFRFVERDGERIPLVPTGLLKKAAKAAFDECEFRQYLDRPAADELNRVVYHLQRELVARSDHRQHRPPRC